MFRAFTAVFLLIPRLFIVFWWLSQPQRWESSFRKIYVGKLWWLWPILGMAFLPWTTLMYVLVSAGRIVSWDWLVGLAILGDIVSFTALAGRKGIPSFEE